MAQKRMFNKKITESDAFVDMPASTQNLYFHLNMNADDDGFVSSPKKIMRGVGAKDDDYKILLAKRFLIAFQSGVCVIKHWLVHNTLRKDRYLETTYLDEKHTLMIKDNSVYTNGKPNGNQMATQIRLDKIRLDKIKKSVFLPPKLEEVQEYCKERNNSVDAETFIDFYTSKGWMVGKNKMKDWKASVRTWERSSSGAKPVQERWLY